MTRAESLRNDLENMNYARRHYIGVLAELEQLGATHSAEFKQAEENVRVLSHNIRKVEAELEKEEEREFDEIDPSYFSVGLHW